MGKVKIDEEAPDLMVGGFYARIDAKYAGMKKRERCESDWEEEKMKWKKRE